MSDPAEKQQHGLRRHRTENAIRRQVDIARAHGAPVEQTHRLHKKHAMDCGQPGCTLCGNPRKIFRELTIQEKKIYQDMDVVNNRRSNQS